MTLLFPHLFLAIERLCYCHLREIYSLIFLVCSLIEEIIVFSHNIVEWVFNALQDLPAALGIRKVQSESLSLSPPSLSYSLSLSLSLTSFPSLSSIFPTLLLPSPSSSLPPPLSFCVNPKRI